MTPESRKKKTRSRDEIICRRVTILAVVAAVMMLLAVGLKLWIREPEVTVPPADNTEQDGELTQTPGRRNGVYTFLLLGRDTGGGGNTDTMMVATYDTINQTVDVMNIYRDTMVNAPWDIKRINAVYSLSGGGEKGIAALKGYLEDLLGFAPDYYVTIEWDAVGELVDAIGGVEFDVPYEMHYWDPTQDLLIDQEKGYRTLYGDDAMQVIRWRKNNDGSGTSVGDIGRVKIQQDFLKAVMKKCLNTINISTLPKYAQIMLDNVTTDLAVGSIVWLGQRALSLDLENLRFHGLPGDLNGAAWSRTYENYQSYVLPDGEAIVELVNGYFNPYTYDIELDDLDIMSVNRDGSLSSSRGTVNDTPAAYPPVKPSKEPEVPVETPVETEEPEPSEQPGEQPGESEEPGETTQPPVTEEPNATGEPPATELPPETESPVESEPPVEEPVVSPEPTEENTPQVLPAMPTPVA